jgi:hypothetical protein
MEVSMSAPSDLNSDDPYGFKALIRRFESEQSERYKAELEAGASAEREEEIQAWFSLQEVRERHLKARFKREGKEGPLAKLTRPSVLN